MVCIGGGAAGMVTAAGSAMVGGKAAIIERAFMGGDCLVSGCVPSKAFLHSASEVFKIRKAKKLGLINFDGDVSVDFA